MDTRLVSIHLGVLYSLVGGVCTLFVMSLSENFKWPVENRSSFGGSDCSVTSYGAVGDGQVDDTLALKAALKESLHVCFPSGVFKITGPLKLRDGQIVSGTGISQALTKEVTGSTKLLFSGGSVRGPAISGFAADRSIQHTQLKDLSIHVTDTYSWVIDLQNPVGCDFSNIEIATRNDITGGIRTTKDSEFSWVNSFMNVQVRLPNLSTASNLDLSHGDFHILGGNFSGGTGAVIGGTGGDRIVGARFDNAGLHPKYNKYNPNSPEHPMRDESAGLRIKAANRYRQPIVSACQIENNGKYDLVIDADITTMDQEDVLVLPIIANNLFRSFHADASIHLKNETGKVVSGGVIQGNSFNAENHYILFDESRWVGAVIGPNHYREGNHAILPKLTKSFSWIDKTGIHLPDGNIRVGNGSPEGEIAAVPGTLYLNSAGGKASTLFIKEAGVGVGGWVAK